MKRRELNIAAYETGSRPGWCMEISGASNIAILDLDGQRVMLRRQKRRRWSWMGLVMVVVPGLIFTASAVIGCSLALMLMMGGL